MLLRNNISTFSEDQKVDISMFLLVQFWGHSTPQLLWATTVKNQKENNAW